MSTSEETTRTPLTLCWHCDRALDAATDIEDPPQTPAPGAVSLCLYCGAVAIFGDDLVLRAPTEAELEGLGGELAFRMAFYKFSWARQFVMQKESLMRDREDPDR